MNKVRKYWEEEANPSYAHLIDEKGRGLSETSLVLKLFEENFLNKIDFQSKTIVDYGLGGGWLGRYLFLNKQIGNYVGVDIAQRSIDTAKKILSRWSTRCRFYLTPVNFLQLQADIFISLACIQHFPSEAYLLGFLDNLNTSGVSRIVLQIRNGETCFNKAYDSEGDVGRACVTTPEFVSKCLSMYNLEFASNISYRSNYQYLIFKKVSEWTTKT